MALGIRRGCLSRKRVEDGQEQFHVVVARRREEDWGASHVEKSEVTSHFGSEQLDTRTFIQVGESSKQISGV